jgi:hypothetical protein
MNGFLKRRSEKGRRFLSPMFRARKRKNSQQHAVRATRRRLLGRAIEFLAGRFNRLPQSS